MKIFAIGFSLSLTLIGCGSDSDTGGFTKAAVYVLNGVSGECVSSSSAVDGPYDKGTQTLVDGDYLNNSLGESLSYFHIEPGNHTIGFRSNYYACSAVFASVSWDFARGHRYFAYLTGAADKGTVDLEIVDVTGQLVDGRLDLVLVNLATHGSTVKFLVGAQEVTVAPLEHSIMASPGKISVNIDSDPSLVRTLVAIEDIDEYLVYKDTWDLTDQELVHGGLGE